VTQRQPFVTSDGTLEFMEVLGVPLPPVGSRTLTPPNPNNGASAQLCDGRFVTVREDSNGGLSGRLLDSDGHELTPDFVVSPFQEGGATPSVASTSDGGFAVAWHAWRGPTTAIVYARKFDARGKPQFTRVRISEPRGENSWAYAVGLPSGQIAILWHDVGHAATRVFVRILSATMKLTGPPIAVVDGRVGRGYLRVMCDGTLVALWNTDRGIAYRADAARVLGKLGTPAPQTPFDFAELTKDCATSP